MSKLVQRELNFTRGEQLALRREVSLPPGEKFLLWILDDHIGSARCWTMSMGQLQAESGFSRSATYNYVNRLCDRGLVWWDELPDNRREYHICWANVAEAIEAQQARPEASTNPPGGKPVHLVESESTTWTLSPRRGRASPPGGLHILNSAPLNAPNNAPSTPPAPASAPPAVEPAAAERTDSAPADTAATEDDGEILKSRRAENLRSLRDCGVGAFVTALDQAQANGMTPDQVGELLEFYRRHPGRWPPQVLFKRLTRPEAAFLAADEGWFGETAEWAAEQQRRALAARSEAEQRRNAEERAVAMQKSAETQKLETRWGALLDALPDHECLNLFSADSPLRKFLQRQGRQSHLIRPELLRALERRECPVHVQPELFGEVE